jgi:hypothetical protein
MFYSRRQVIAVAFVVLFGGGQGSNYLPPSLPKMGKRV